MASYLSVIVFSCMSVLETVPNKTETIAYKCPETVHMYYEPGAPYVTPKEYAHNMHLTDGHRDDRMPPEVKKVSQTKKVASTSKSKRKYKRKKRRT